jgi:hypothetical protein
MEGDEYKKNVTLSIYEPFRRRRRRSSILVSQKSYYYVIMYN